MDDISVHFGILPDQVPQRLGSVPSVLVCNRATKVSLSQTGQRLSLQVSLGQTGHGLGKHSPPVRPGHAFCDSEAVLSKWVQHLRLGAYLS